MDDKELEGEELEGITVGPHNINEIMAGAADAMRKVDLDIGVENMHIRNCHVCGVSMLTQPAAMQLTEHGPIYFCESHMNPLT